MLRRTTMLLVAAAVLAPMWPAAYGSDRFGPGSMESHQRLAKGLRRAVLGLHPAFQQAYRRARQLDETRLWNYRDVGDIDRDGYNDILVDLWVMAHDPAGVFLINLSGTYRGTLLSGRTGDKLFSVDSEFVDGFAGLRPFRLGPDGKPGLLLTESSLFSTA